MKCQTSYIFSIQRNASELSTATCRPFWSMYWYRYGALRWRHNGHDSVSNHQPHHCLLNRLFGCRSKKTSKLRVTGLCAENSPGTGEFPAQMASSMENVSIWWRHHGIHLNWYCSVCRGGDGCLYYSVVSDVLVLKQYQYPQCWLNIHPTGPISEKI